MQKTIPSLNADVTIDILTRLPVKTLARFRCVCKHWHSHASHPRLLYNHSARTANQARIAGFFLCDTGYNLQYTPLPVGHSAGLPDTSLSFLPDSANGVTLCSSCNGLILCKLANSPRNFVCNPTTMEYFEIPTQDGVCQTALSLAFDPTKSPYFKVVAVCKQVHVYSSETHTWRMVSLDSPFYCVNDPTYCRPSVYWNGLLVWDCWLDWLVTYDVEQDCIGTLPFPQIPWISPSTRWRCQYLAVSKGSLHMIGGLEDIFHMMIQFDILEMKPDCEWSILYHVRLNDVRNLFPEIDVMEFQRSGLRDPAIWPAYHLVCWPLCILRGEDEEEEDILLLSIPGRIVAYNLEKRMIKEVCRVTSLVMSDYGWYRFFSYIHTLVSLRSD